MKTYKVTEEIKELFGKGMDAAKCRDVAIAICPWTKTALRYSAITRRHFNKAWKLTKQLHPETAEGSWYFHVGSGEVRQGIAPKE